MFQQLSQALGLDASEVGSFVGEPVHLDEQVLYPVKNYGSAVTPFYTNLALWVGGFVLVAIYKLEVDRDEKIRMYTPRQAYMGRWLLFVTVGFLQAIIATIGDLALGIQCEHPFLFILAGIFASFVYVNIIYALAVAFRHIGKAVAVILVIIQIPGAAGLYPIEMMPEFFRRLKPFLPFTYGINAMRGPIGGMYANHYWIDMLSLFWYLPVALFIGLVVRKLALNLNRLFDNRLADTDLMITEHTRHGGTVAAHRDRAADRRGVPRTSPQTGDSFLPPVPAPGALGIPRAGGTAVRVPAVAIHHAHEARHAARLDHFDHRHRHVSHRGGVSARTVCELSGRGSDECGRVPQRDPAREPAVPAGHALQADACRTHEAV